MHLVSVPEQLRLINNMIFVLQQSEHFSFLGINNQSNLSDMRCRTTFYTALGRLLMVDLGTATHSCAPNASRAPPPQFFVIIIITN